MTSEALATAPVDLESELAAPVLIAGEPLATGGEEVHNPARTDEVVGWVALGGPAEVDGAVSAAVDAYPAWSALPPVERGEHLRRAAERLRETIDVEGLARLLTREHGKVLWESRLDVSLAPAILDHYASMADRLEEQVSESERGRRVIARRPMGVAGIVVPWNFPTILGFHMLAPALLAGNTVVVKPAVEVPLAFSHILRVVSRALPRGVLNSVPGHGEAAGQALVTHADVRKVAFTGSVETGARILEAAAPDIKRVTLELGGNDPALVLEDAEVDERLFEELTRGVYTSTGQICYNVKRIYVHRSHYRDFLEGFCAKVDELVVGDGLDERSDIGPLNSRAQQVRVDELIRDAAASGATVHHLGSRLDPAGWGRGHFSQPAVVSDVDPSSPLVREEQFGPVVPVLPVDSDEEAIAAANATDYGLAASIWSRDVDRAFELARGIEAGSVFVNVHRVGASDITTPFGGFKRSGIGRTHGFVPVEENTEIQACLERRDM